MKKMYFLQVQKLKNIELTWLIIVEGADCVEGGLLLGLERVGR